jgi:hypothetical protein
VSELIYGRSNTASAGQFQQREARKIVSMNEERLVYLTPVTDELMESADVGDMGPHTRCTECKKSDFVAYYIHHKSGCSVAARIAKSIDGLSDSERKEREEMESHL